MATKKRKAKATKQTGNGQAMALSSDILPLPEPRFSGRIGSTYADSEAEILSLPAAPAGAPNILLVLLDDVGFGQTSTFGGPANTPTLQRLADEGLRYNRFHTTALCSPTRAALLSGRNHHSVHTGCITELATGFPGYDGQWPKEAGCIAEILRSHQYATAAFGKWHNTPDHELGAGGPYDRWPTGKGFDHWYGFQGGETNQWFTPLFENTAPVEMPHDNPKWHLSEALADRAIGWMAQQKAAAPDKPFFVYFAPGAAHAPHHVAKEWADKYKGKFDDGWDKLRERTFARQKELGIVPAEAQLSRHDPDVPEWEPLSATEKKVYARMMEVFAGFLTHTDYHIGRLIEFLKNLGELDNTIIMAISDNGASAEGGPSGMVNEALFFNNVQGSLEENLAALDKLGGPEFCNHYAWGWTWAGNTPFRR